MELTIDTFYNAELNIAVHCPDCKALVTWSAGPRDCWFENDKLAVLPFECLVCHLSGSIHLTLK